VGKKGGALGKGGENPRRRGKGEWQLNAIDTGTTFIHQGNAFTRKKPLV
jgi:hypothetical protein